MRIHLWQLGYIIGLASVLGLMALEAIGLQFPSNVVAGVELVGGVLVIGGSAEAFVLSVEGISYNMNMTDYVSGIYASLAATIPELSIITFLLLAEQFEMAWVLALATIFVNSLVFAVYTLILPKDEQGNFRLPDAIMWVGSDMLNMGSVISLSVGFSMLMVFVFALTNPQLPTSLDAGELFVFGGCLVAVFIAYLYRITKYYGKCDPSSDDRYLACEITRERMPRQTVVVYLVMASFGALIGGEALSSFATFTTDTIGLSFIHAALLLAVFAGAPEYIIVTSSHMKDEIEIALSNAFGGIVQVFFVIFGFTLIASGIIGPLLGVTSGLIPIDLFSVLLLVFAFPSMFILRIMITDDAHINALESIAMIAVFLMMLYILLVYGIYPLTPP
ncbi:MAG: hypothetical protein ACE5H4_10355 [Candidatus Thorarchaeota archaeon]